LLWIKFWVTYAFWHTRCSAFGNDFDRFSYIYNVHVIKCIYNMPNFENQTFDNKHESGVPSQVVDINAEAVKEERINRVREALKGGLNSESSLKSVAEKEISTYSELLTKETKKLQDLVKSAKLKGMLPFGGKKAAIKQIMEGVKSTLRAKEVYDNKSTGHDEISIAGKEAGAEFKSIEHINKMAEVHANSGAEEALQEALALGEKLALEAGLTADEMETLWGPDKPVL